MDVETVPKGPIFADLDQRTKDIFTKRSKGWQLTDEERDNPQTAWTSRAAFFAEFNQVVCVSFGRIDKDEEGKAFLRVKAFTSANEAELLKAIAPVISHERTGFMVAHNGLYFDYPMLFRKYMIHGLPIPSMLQVSGKKPWEVLLFDTLEIWKGTEYRGGISLDALSMAFGFESPKEEMTGADVGAAFWIMKDLEKIGIYCNGDVVCGAKCYLKMINAPMFERVVFA